MIKHQITCIIPARGGSKRIENKNLIAFCGKPLLAWSIEQALRSQYVQDVYVSTNDVKIAEVAQAFGAKVIERPEELAKDTSRSEDALLHAIKEIEKEKKVEDVLFLQATSPVRMSKDIDQAIQKFYNEGADSLFSDSALKDFCVWKNKEGDLDSVTYDYRKRYETYVSTPYLIETGSIYIFTKETLLKYNNRLGGKIVTYSMPIWTSFEIDALEDVGICEFYMKDKILNKQTSDKMVKDVELIVYDFDGVLTDNTVIVREDGLESVKVNRSDGLAIGMIKGNEIPQIILSTETNDVVVARAKKLGLPILKGLKNKRETLKAYCEDHKIDLQKVIYIGNDINDLEAMKMVGWPVAPQDAAEEIKRIARITLSKKGGEGVVRELITFLNLNRRIAHVH